MSNTQPDSNQIPEDAERISFNDTNSPTPPVSNEFVVEGCEQFTSPDERPVGSEPMPNQKEPPVMIEYAVYAAAMAELTEAKGRAATLSLENYKLKSLMRRALPTIESRITDFGDEFKAAIREVAEIQLRERLFSLASALEHTTSEPSAATRKPKTQREIDEEIAESMRQATVD